MQFVAPRDTFCCHKPILCQEAEVEKDLMACYEKRPAMAYVDSRRGITNLHVPRSKVQAKRTAKMGA